MTFDWENETERLRRQMAIPAKQKLEWLLEMNCFSDTFTPPRNKAIRKKLRENDGRGRPSP